MKSKREVTYHLVLNEDEADWLKGVLQNPLYPYTHEDEPEEDQAMRKTFWEALKQEKT